MELRSRYRFLSMLALSISVTYPVIFSSVVHAEEPKLDILFVVDSDTALTHSWLAHESTSYCNATYSSRNAGDNATCTEGGAAALSAIRTKTPIDEARNKTCGASANPWSKNFRNYTSGSKDSCNDGFLYVLALVKNQRRIDILTQASDYCLKKYARPSDINYTVTCIQGSHAALANVGDVNPDAKKQTCGGSSNPWSENFRNYYTGSQESCEEGFDRTVNLLGGAKATN